MSENQFGQRDISKDEGEAKQLSHPQVVSTPDEQSEPRPYHLTERTEIYAERLEHSGPLPTTEYLREINEIIPNGAERIMAMAEKHAEHRQRMEQEELEAVVEYSREEMIRSNRGLAAGFAVAMSLVGATVYLVATGHDIPGTIVGSFDVVGLVSVFVIGRIYSRQDASSPTESPSKESDASEEAKVRDKSP